MRYALMHVRRHAFVLTLLLAACGGGHGGGGGTTGSGAGASAGTGAAASAVQGVVPQQSQATLSFLVGSEGGPGFNNGAGAAAQFDFLTSIAVDAQGNRYVLDSQNFVIRKIDPQNMVSVYAGQVGIAGENDGSAATAHFGPLSSMTIDASGNLYVAENSGMIREVASDGSVVTLNSSGGGLKPTGLTFDAQGNLYFADPTTSLIEVMTPSQQLSRVAGGIDATIYQDGPVQTATFVDPVGIAADTQGNLYVADQGDDVIRKITPQGMVSTLAGMPRVAGTADGNGQMASFSNVTSISFDGNELLVADGTRLRTISLAGEVTTIYDFGTGQFAYPSGAVRGPDGEIDVALPLQVVQVADNGTLTAVAGQALLLGDADGAGSLARFNNFSSFSQYGGIAVDGAGTLYVADLGNGAIRKVSANAVVTTLAGSTTPNPDGTPMLGYVDATGQAARFTSPTGIAVNAAGIVYVSDRQVIRQITPAGVVTTLAGMPHAPSVVASDGKGKGAIFNNPGALVVDSAGNLFVADNPYIGTGGAELGATVRRIAPDGTVTTVAGNPAIAQSLDGTAGHAGFVFITALALDRSGNLLATDSGSGSAQVREINGAASVSTLSPGLASGGSETSSTNSLANAPVGLAVDASGQIFISTVSCDILKFEPGVSPTPVYAGTQSSCGNRLGSLPGGIYIPNALAIYGNGLAVATPGSILTIH